MTRAFSGAELAARTWYYLSAFPNERGLAARRWRALAHIAPGDVLLPAFGDIAFDGYHARALTERIVRDRVERVRYSTPADPVKAAAVRDMLERVVLATRLTPRGGGFRP